VSFPRYPAYADSGVDWIGEIPTHWTVLRLKHSLEDVRNGVWGDEARGDSDDVICVRVADFDRVGLRVRLENPTTRNVPEGERSSRALSHGNLLIEKSGGGETQPVGCVVLYDAVEPAVCSNFVARVRLKSDCVPSFWCYLHFAAYAARVNTKSIKQTSGIQNLDSGAYFNELAAYPPRDEQRAIAAFLDRETAKIDALVAEQERLIALLKEKRQAVISHAVTKGSDPDAPMQDSGVEWLGTIPAHWTMMRLKHLTPSLTVGIVVNPSDYVSEQGLPFIYGGDIREGIIDTEHCRRISEESSRANEKTRLRAGDLLVVRVGAPGVAAVVPPECEGGNCASVMLVRRGNFISEWLCFLLNTRVVRYQVEVVQYGAAQEQFNISHAEDFWVPVPPVEEQSIIAEVLRTKAVGFDELSREVEENIALLVERRAALITAAVTGQIDVRRNAPGEAA
jgi:type I restriction enzyme S subunit